MSSEILINGNAALANQSCHHLLGAVNQELETRPESSEVSADYSDSDTLTYLANTFTNEFFAVSLEKDDDLDVALDRRRLFNFRVTRMCFAINLLARSGLAPLGRMNDTNQNHISKALVYLDNNSHTHSHIDDTSLCLREDGTPGTDTRALALYAGRYNALFQLASGMGGKSATPVPGTTPESSLPKPDKPTGTYRTALDGGVIALGAFGKLLDITIKEEKREERIYRELKKSISDL
jgi:hypothetical protein